MVAPRTAHGDRLPARLVRLGRVDRTPRTTAVEIMKRNVLIDGDVLVHAVVAGCTHWEQFGSAWIQVCDEDELRRTLSDTVLSWAERAGGGHVTIALSDLADNWRYGVYPDYKKSRRGAVRSPMFMQAREHLEATCDTMLEPGLEADDLLGLGSTCPAVERPVIVTIDKDLGTIPGLLFNPQKDLGVVEVAEREADLMHMVQALSGDRVDEYPGCPGLGDIRARRMLESLEPTEWWPAVVEAYAKKDLDEAFALSQARVARILRHGEYDWTKRKVKLWRPK
jgi:Autographiviridae exonuclease